MFEFKAVINTTDGEILEDRIYVKEKKCLSGVTAVFVDALIKPKYGSNRKGTIHPDKGVCIDVCFDGKIKGIMANYRCDEFWCTPAFLENMSDIPDETQLLIVEQENGRFIVVVPVLNDRYKNVIVGKSENTFTVREFSWYDGLYDMSGLSFVYAFGENPHMLVECCVKEALKILNNGTRHISERRYPEVLEYLGWCTWDSMQIKVCEEGILEKCEEFKEKNVPVKWAMIDDMWAEVREFYDEEYNSFREMVDLMYSSTMYHFEADPRRFPKGLKSCINKVKRYGLDVGIWHPTTGYWRGITPEGEAYRQLSKYLIETEDNMLVPDWHSDKSYKYYKTMHDFFRKCGVDFIKIDNQSMTRRFYKGLAPIGKIAKEFHDGMEASVGEHFDNAMINCMGMGSEDIWSRTVSPVSRCSGDFQPENKEWFKKHILQCAYNSILQGQFYWCDWDMWWTDDGQAMKNSLMRAISGGPIYVSDMIGRSNPEFFKPLVLDDGSILRCDRPCTPAKDCITVDCTKNKKAFKLQNIAGEYGIMTLLNIDENGSAVTAKVSSDDIEGLEAQEYAVYEHFSRELRILKHGEWFDIELSTPDEYRLYIFAPIKEGFAVIGRTDKFISPKTVEYVCDEKIVLKEKGECAYVKDGVLCFGEGG